MNFPLFIARKYFFSPKKKAFINWISLMSMIGVGLGICFLIIVLSVFNGLEDLLRSLHSSFDPDLRITLVEGKTFHEEEVNTDELKDIAGIAFITPTLEDNALLQYKNAKMLVRLKGVGQTFDQNTVFKNTIVAGNFMLQSDSSYTALIGRGVKYALAIDLSNSFYALQFMVPKNSNRKQVNPANLLNKKIIMPAGVFEIERQIDEKYVIVPLPFARDLFEKKSSVSALEIYFSDDADESAIIDKIQNLLGSRFKIENREEQHSEIYKLLKIEKIFVFGTFAFILLIASFNVFFTLSMLAIEKRNDLSILHSMGLPVMGIRRIFLIEGALIAGLGALVGLILGISLCLLQQYTGFISMGMETAIMDAYPVKVEILDVILTILIMVSITYGAAYSPASLASKAIQNK